MLLSNTRVWKAGEACGRVVGIIGNRVGKLVSALEIGFGAKRQMLVDSQETQIGDSVAADRQEPRVPDYVTLKA